MNVLIVDDEPAIAKPMAVGFEQRGESARAAFSLVEAEEILARSSVPFDVIILDIHLGSESGLKLIEVLRRKHSVLPSFFLFTGDDQFDVSSGYELGADAVFRKGRCSFESIYKAVKHFDQKGRRIRELQAQQILERQISDRREAIQSSAEIAVSILHEISNGVHLVALLAERHEQILGEAVADSSYPTRVNCVKLRSSIDRLQRTLASSRCLFRGESLPLEVCKVSELLKQVEEVIRPKIIQGNIELRISNQLIHCPVRARVTQAAS